MPTRSKFTTRCEFTTCSIWSTAGSFGILDWRKRAFWNRKRAFRNEHFQNTALRLLLFSIRQRFGLHAKNARAENPLVKNGINTETACVLGCVLKTQRFNNAFWPIFGDRDRGGQNLRTLARGPTEAIYNREVNICREAIFTSA